MQFGAIRDVDLESGVAIISDTVKPIDCAARSFVLSISFVGECFSAIKLAHVIGRRRVAPKDWGVADSNTVCVVVELLVRPLDRLIVHAW
ncbi:MULTISPECIES: hypothetical protein [unclassified Bradyrhizobium]|uniref:hypothetical protein n=1 Tax=unclassified Bradyrhizobium TaxID=2631580 RepID=UPI002478A9B3|nr:MULTISPECIES: hypothetical protein [unclassified Bradyrhizobium]WGR68662.1 hypothetical protein MTX24_24910 [Bradyrhizobium sp. ISRA426]WGR80717.1 hypothetical protein MTX21_10025 [Bradyrhizobium sp. ISRA430]WGR83902.1 hypothetical protein MTX25_24590 [Bradyrhizobium sp. ISRA432]